MYIWKRLKGGRETHSFHRKENEKKKNKNRLMSEVRLYTNGLQQRLLFNLCPLDI